jgi:hypothetical protein
MPVWFQGPQFATNFQDKVCKDRKDKNQVDYQQGGKIFLSYDKYR